VRTEHVSTDNTDLLPHNGICMLDRYASNREYL